MIIFAHTQRTDRQSSREQILNSKTEATLILCGSSGERANNELADISDAFPLYKTIFWQKKHSFTQNTLEKNEMIHILYHYK